MAAKKDDLAPGIVAPAELPEEAFAAPVAATDAAYHSVELRVAELADFLKGEMHHFGDDVDGVVKLVADRLKAIL